MPLNTNAIKWSIFSNLPKIIYNLSAFRELTAKFLTDITQGQDFDNYRSTLTPEELIGFDQKAHFVKGIVAQLQNINRDFLSALTDQAGSLKPIFTRVDKDNVDTKRKFFQQNMDALSNYLAKLKELRIELSKEAESSLRDTVAGCALREIHYQSVQLELKAISAEPEFSKADILEKIKQSNTGDDAAAQQVKIFFTEIANYPCHYEIYLNEKLATIDDISSLVLSGTPSEAECQNAVTIRIAKYRSREDYLNLCSPELRLRINDNSEELEKQLDELTKQASEKRISELKISLLAESARLQETIVPQIAKLTEELAGLQETHHRLSELKFLLSNGELSPFLTHFSNETELRLFCITYELNETTEKSLVKYYQQSKWLTFASDFLGGNSAYLGQLHDEIIQAETKLQSKIQPTESKLYKLKNMNKKLAALKIVSPQKQLLLIKLLKAFSQKDKPCFFYGKAARKTFDAFLSRRDAFLKELNCMHHGYRPSPESEARVYTESNQLYADYLSKSGICLFGGQYRQRRKAMQRLLESSVITPSG